jgi:hypothetical protein
MAAMRTLSGFTCATLLVACAVSDQRITHPAAPPGRTTSVFAVTEPAPAGSVLRVFVDPDKLVGWIAGQASYAGKVVYFDGHPTRAIVGTDNSFELPLAFAKRADAEVRVGELSQVVAIEPAVEAEPAAYVVTDRGAYRPGQKLQLTAFLRRLEHGELRPALKSPVEVQLISDTKKTVAAKLLLAVDASGRAAGEYTFSAADPLDTYTVQIPGFRGTAKVTLAEYRKAKVKLDVDAKVVDGDAEVSFRALDFLDHGVAGGSVSFTAQVVRQPETKAALRGFAYEGPRVLLQRDEVLLHAADPDTAGRLWDAGRYVVSQVEGKVTLDGKGNGAYRVPLEGSYLRGRHDLVVASTMVDPNGYEQRTTRTIPLARRDHRVQIETAHALVASGGAVDVTVRVTDAAGRLVVPASTSIAAVKISPPQDVVLGNSYLDNGLDNNLGNWVGGPNGGHWVNNTNGSWIGSPNGGHWVGNTIVNLPNCRFTNLGCVRLRATRGPRRAQLIPDDTLAATAAVIGDRASLEIPDPGAYRLIASAKLLDGSTVWGEAGVAVREKTRMPDVVLELDRSELDHGDRIAGTLSSRYRDAAALLLVRDATGIKSHHRAIVANGVLRFDLPSTGLTYGASVEAYLLGADSIEAAQQAVRINPTHRELSIKTQVKDSYGPGDVVDLGIEVGTREPVDLVVSVYDQALLGIAPDHSIDPRNFFFADDRVHAHSGLATLRAQLGDLTVGEVLELAKQRAGQAPRTPDGNFEREAATVLEGLYRKGQRFSVGTAMTTLRYLGIPVTASPAAQYQTSATAFTASITRTRLVELLAGLPIAFVRAGDAIAMFDPTQEVMRPVQGLSFDGAASGNATFSTGNASYSRSVPSISYVPAGPQPLSGMESSSTIRRDFSDSAFWTGTARTDAAGHARVTFKLPDSLTNWQVVVTAIGRNRVGRQLSKLRTVRDVMIWPLLPRQMVEGDTVTVGASVHNLTDRDRDIAVTLQTENVDVLTPAALTVRVPRNTSVPVSWSVRARSPGLATLLASAATPGAPPDASLKKIPIVSSSAEQLVTASGFATKPLQLELPDGLDPKHTRLELTFAPSLAADMAKTLDYLVEYPYGCAEQTMSRFAPAIEVAGVLENLGIRDGALAARLPGVVAGGLKRLTELQQPDGGWGWIGNGTTHEMITPYVTWGLLRAERAGYKLPDPKTLPRALEKIFAFAQSLDDRQPSDRIYLMYVYGQKHALPDAWWTWLVARADKLTDYALALALEIAVKRGDRTVADRFARTLRARAIVAEQGVHWKTAGFSRWMEDPFEVSAVVLAALVAHDSSDPLIAQSIAYFTATKRGDRWNSTKDTAMVLYAMTAYVRAQRLTADKTTAIDFAVDGGAPRHLAFPDGLSRTVTIEGTALSRKPTITFPKAAPGITVHAVARYRRTGRNLAPLAQGLTVTRTVQLIDAAGKRTPLKSGDRVPRGSYVESVVRVEHAQKEMMRFLLIEDPKPAGAEALPATDRRLARYGTPWVFREDRETHLAFHHEQVPQATQVATILHLESAGELAFVPASAELMYQTQTRGHSGSYTLRVE